MKKLMERRRVRGGTVTDVFANTNTLAAYYPNQQNIELSGIDVATFDLAVNEPNSDEALQVLPLVLHELRHWLDHIGTCWGQQRLISLFNAFHAWMTQDTDEFWRMADFRLRNRRDRFEKYYTTVGRTRPSTPDQMRWLAQLTAGKRFDVRGRLDDDLPIAFTRFQWPDRAHACRVPFSVASLLECNAVYFEQAMHVATLAKQGFDGDSAKLQAFQQNSIEELYSPELGVYSVAAHLAANQLSISEVLRAYTVASDLAGVCLNLPASWFAKLKVPEAFRPWGDVNSKFIANQDRGYAYMALVHHAGELEGDDTVAWVDGTLAAAGLPSLMDLVEAARTEMTAVRSQAVAGRFRPRLEWLLDSGLKVFDTLGVIMHPSEFMAHLSELPTPPIVLSEGDVRQLSASTQWDQVGALEVWMRETLDLEDRFGEFFSACGH